MIDSMNQKKYRWITISLAATVTMIHIVLLYLHVLDDEYGSFRYDVWGGISDGILDCLIVYMMLCAWILRKRALSHALLLATVSMAAYYLSACYRGSIYEVTGFVIGILAMLAPFTIWSIVFVLQEKMEKEQASKRTGTIWSVAVLAIVIFTALFDGSLSRFTAYIVFMIAVILEGCACIWLSVREYNSEDERKEWLCRAWVGSVALSILITNQYADHILMPLDESCWGTALRAAMPILYAVLLRLLMGRNWNDITKITLYYLSCMIIAYEFGNSIFGLVMPVLICMVEYRSKNSKTWWRTAISSAYAFAWAALCIFRSERLREIIYHLGGPAVNIKLTERVDWLGYKLTAVRSYFVGNTYGFFRYFLNKETPLDYWADQGYLRFYDDDTLGALTFQFGSNWLVIMAALVVAVAILLIMKSMAQRKVMSRNMQYMGIGYLIRTAESCLYIVTMSVLNGGDFPFNAGSLMDLLVLWLLLRYGSDTFEEG